MSPTGQVIKGNYRTVHLIIHQTSLPLKKNAIRHLQLIRQRSMQDHLSVWIVVFHVYFFSQQMTRSNAQWKWGWRWKRKWKRIFFLNKNVPLQLDFGVLLAFPAKERWRLFCDLFCGNLEVNAARPRHWTVRQPHSSQTKVTSPVLTLTIVLMLKTSRMEHEPHR